MVNLCGISEVLQIIEIFEEQSRLESSSETSTIVSGIKSGHRSQESQSKEPECACKIFIRTHSFIFRRSKTTRTTTGMSGGSDMTSLLEKESNCIVSSLLRLFLLVDIVLLFLSFNSSKDIHSVGFQHKEDCAPVISNLCLKKKRGKTEICGVRRGDLRLSARGSWSH